MSTNDQTAQIRELREHFDQRCNSQDAKLDNLLLAVRGNGLDGAGAVEGLAARTNKHDHYINGLKLTLPVLGNRVASVEVDSQVLMTAHKDRKRAMWLVAGGSLTSVGAALWAWATAWVSKGGH